MTGERILIVDDEAHLRMSLRAFLEDLGFAVEEASCGSEALAVCRGKEPDLVLLDISMPGIDGFETCRRLKADPERADLPVLFLSALMGTEEKVRAFRSGGVDYVTKPFQFEEVEARVRRHLELLRQRRQLQEQHEALLKLEKLRDSFTHMVAHDLRSPLTAITGSMDLLEDELQGDRPELHCHLDLVRRTVGQMVARIDQMLDVSRLEDGRMPLDVHCFDLAGTVRECIRTLAPLAGSRRIRLEAGERVLVEGDARLLGRVLENLLGNAFKFTAPEGEIGVRIAEGEEGVRVSVCDDGPGIAADQASRIFEKFEQASPGDRHRGAGLGLAFCRLAVEAHRGRIGISSEAGKGCEFWFTLPAGGAAPVA